MKIKVIDESGIYTPVIARERGTTVIFFGYTLHINKYGIPVFTEVE